MTRAVFAVAAAFAMSAGAITASRLMHPAIPVAAYALAIVLVLLAATGRTRTAEKATTLPAKERLGLALLAIAVTVVVFDRHQVVASSGAAPDDLAAIGAAIACLATAVRAPGSARWRAVAYGLVLATYLLAGAILISTKPYHSDAVVATHAGAELVLAGKHPYADFDMFEQLPRFGLHTGWATHLDDGSSLRSLNYPALSVLVPAPLVALGLQDVRALYLAETLAIVGLVLLSAAEPWRAFALAAAVGNAAVMRQHVLAGVDPAWALFVLIAWLARERRWSAVALGLAVAARQTAWPFAPFVVAWYWRRHGRREALARAGIAAGLALAVHLPFLVADPAAVIGGITDVIRLPLVAGGVGPSQLLGGLPRELYLAAAAAVFVAGLAWWWTSLARRDVGRAALVLPLAPLYVASRALQSYFAFLPLFVLVEEGREASQARTAAAPSQAAASTDVASVGRTSDGNS